MSLSLPDARTNSIFGGEINDVDMLILAQFFATNGYNGFDGIVTRNEFVARCNAKGMDPKKVLMFFISWYVSRGTKLPGETKTKKLADGKTTPSKQLTGLAQEATSTIQEYVTKLNVESRITTQSTPRTLTISRIIAAAPAFIAKAIAAMIGNGIPIRQVAQPPANFPLYLCFPQSGSIIPRSNKALFELYKEYYRANDKVINSGIPSDNIDQYINNIHNSPLMNDEERQKVLEECERLKTKEVKGVRDAYSKKKDETLMHSSAPGPTQSAPSSATFSTAPIQSENPLVRLMSGYLGQLLSKDQKALVPATYTFNDIIIGALEGEVNILTAYEAVQKEKISMPEFINATYDESLTKAAKAGKYRLPETKL